jgi:hypothetical protein
VGFLFHPTLPHNPKNKSNENNSENPLNPFSLPGTERKAFGLYSRFMA